MSAGGSTIGAELERDRLVSRKARLEHIVTVLRNRARGYEDGGMPRAFACALADFQRELVLVSRRLRDS